MSTTVPMMATIVVASSDPAHLTDWGYVALAEGLTTNGIEATVMTPESGLAAGFLLVDRLVGESALAAFCSPPYAPAHTILLNADRSSVFKELEERNLGGAITSVRMAEWLQDPPNDTHAGICGLRSVGDVLGWKMSDGYGLASERYAWMFDPARAGLPAEIAHYLHGLARLKAMDFGVDDG